MNEELYELIVKYVNEQINAFVNENSLINKYTTELEEKIDVILNELEENYIEGGLEKGIELAKIDFYFFAESVGFSDKAFYFNETNFSILINFLVNYKDLDKNIFKRAFIGWIIILYFSYYEKNKDNDYFMETFEKIIEESEKYENNSNYLSLSSIIELLVSKFISDKQEEPQVIEPAEDIEQPKVEVLDISNNNGEAIVFPKDKAINVTSGVFNVNSDIHKDIYSGGETCIDYRNKNEKSKNNKNITEAYAIMTMLFDNNDNLLKELNAIDFIAISIISNYQLNEGNKISLYECTKMILGKKKVTKNEVQSMKERLKHLSSIWFTFSNKNEFKNHKNVPFISYEGHLMNVSFTEEKINNKCVEYVVFQPCLLDNGKFYNVQPCFVIASLKKQLYSVPKELVYNPYNNSLNMTDKNRSFAMVILEIISNYKHEARKGKKKNFKYNLKTIYQKNGIVLKDENNKNGYSNLDSLRKEKKKTIEMLILLLDNCKRLEVIKSYKIDDTNLHLYF